MRWRAFHVEQAVSFMPMPLYEYRCNSCAETFELLRPMADRELRAVCPSCESTTTMPLISRVAISVQSASRRDSLPAAAPRASGGGGCCGGGCGCG
jgi:putative FmdB family regulatory protein